MLTQQNEKQDITLTSDLSSPNNKNKPVIFLKKTFSKLLLNHTFLIALLVFIFSCLAIFFYIDHQQDLLLQALSQYTDTVYTNSAGHISPGSLDNYFFRQAHNLLQSVLMVFVFLLAIFLLSSVFILRHIGDNLGKLRSLDYQTQKINRKLQEEIEKGDNLSEQIEELNTRLKYQIFHDQLTGLPNQLLLEDRLETIINGDKNNNKIFAVVFIELDGLKSINEAFGIDIGDTLLKTMTERILNSMRSSDTVFRLRGQQFVLMITQIENSEAVAFIAERTQSQLSQPFMVGNHQLNLKTYMGISMYPDDGIDTKTLLKNAKFALHQAMENIKENIQFYRENINLINQRKFILKDSLQQAYDKSEFSIDYLPFVNVETGLVVGLKATINWKHAKLGLVSPLELLTLAENAGLNIVIGNWMLRTACQQFRRWNAQGLNLQNIFLSFSPLQIIDPKFLDHLNQILDETEMQPAELVISISEEILINYKNEIIPVFIKLKALGVKIAINNFRGGYISLENLKHLSIDFLKLDYSLVQNITNDKNDLAVIKAITTLAVSLHWIVIAVGVKSVDQRQLLFQQGCKLMQGSLFDEVYVDKFVTNK